MGEPGGRQMQRWLSHPCFWMRLAVARSTQEPGRLNYCCVWRNSRFAAEGGAIVLQDTTNLFCPAH